MQSADGKEVHGAAAQEEVAVGCSELMAFSEEHGTESRGQTGAVIEFGG